MQIVARGARVLGLRLTDDGAREIAQRSRGTPRIAGRLLEARARFRGRRGPRRGRSRRRRCGAGAARSGRPRARCLRPPLSRAHRRRLCGGGPVGIETLAAALGEPRDAIEEIVEPYLIQQSFVQRTSRGRMVTAQAYVPSRTAGARVRPRLSRICSLMTTASAPEPAGRLLRWSGLCLSASGLLRGHRFLRRRLSRELSALHGARPFGIPAGGRRAPPGDARAASCRCSGQCAA